MLAYNPLVDFTIRFLANLLVLFIVSRVIYFPGNKRKEYVFTFIIIGSTVFILCFMLSSINMELGLALGLFAIFGIIRYRTITIVVKEMTYLFFAITISVINSLASAGYSNTHLLIANISMIILIILMEYFWMRKSLSTITIKYEKIGLIQPENHEKLRTDLAERLGIEIVQIKIGNIDFLRDTASVAVTFDAKKYPYFLADHEID
ncbi:MAG: DUF4956 domain-containing protein [Spirochaetales bacterium]|nr:DUF4956 domain-containing protein [Spirochaetales bacterium]